MIYDKLCDLYLLVCEMFAIMLKEEADRTGSILRAYPAYPHLPVHTAPFYYDAYCHAHPPHVSGPSVSSSTCSCLSLTLNNAAPLQGTCNMQEASLVLSVPAFHSTSPVLPSHFSLLDLFL